ncbi:DUF5995 family protein [Mangrovihabitans endophyticus]|uniref:Uncharacterized protein n=1 Tax=Mangrovihabitans endophyticus TaxID=1751298 RepID=A0A8J3FRR3_9ACTN|nr:DUF5995 family protein [Mangrovihabitans endophyticus]GGL13774.1 hypothetical protein GCM10012284_55700 [Mangrovihabitans endophyticus]
MTSFDRHRVRASADRLQDRRHRLAGAVTTRPGWDPAHEEMAEILQTPPTDIGGVLSTLVAVQTVLERLPPKAKANRVAAFNSLYYTITARVARSLTGPNVHDPVFLEQLDVEFAKLYFVALRRWGEGDERTPDVWEVLFRRAQDTGVSRLCAAMLGVNAHINHDLSLALIATWRSVGAPEPHVTHPDYLLVNRIFYEAIPTLRRRYSTPWQLRIDRYVGDLDDWTQDLLVASTRALAWEQGERLWPLRDDDGDFGQACMTMDRAAALVGELLIHGDGVVTRAGVLASAAWRRLRPHRRRSR